MVKGNTLHQIFSNDQFIFSVSSTLEKLYRYRYDLITNEVVEILVFKRVKKGDPEMTSLQKIRPMRRLGTATPFGQTRYDVYALPSNKHIYGYILYARTTYSPNQTPSSERMYFAFEKQEKKER